MPSFLDGRTVDSFVGRNNTTYVIADEDENDGGVSYFGFVNHFGNWVIMERDQSVSPVTDRYAKGKQNYPTNFTGRAGLSYDYYYNIW